MISRWNYLAITTVMLVVLFLFQFTNVALESWNGYEENSYYLERETLPDESSVYKAESGASMSPEDASGSLRDRVIYIGAEEGDTGAVVYTWANYTKRSIDSYKSLEAYQKAEPKGKVVSPEMIVIGSDGVDWEQEGLDTKLKGYIDEGINLVFCCLPDVSVLKEQAGLRKILGIEAIQEDETTVEGIYLQEGFLLGGEAVYRAEDAEENAKRQDMELTFPWYTLGKNTVTYMRGITEELLEEEEDYPVIVWRNSFEKADVFAVNGRYMDDITGLGFLSAMATEMNEYEVYPVVNAQNMVIVNYPGFASENDEEMRERYGQSTAEMFRNIAWPSVVAAYRQNTLGLSCMVAPQYDYEDDEFPNQEVLRYYMRRLREQSAEAGLSGISISDTDIRRKVTEDQMFMEKELPDYRFSSFYAGNLTESEIEHVLNEEILGTVRTVVKDYSGENDLIGYQLEDVTRQSTLSNGTEYTYRDDLRMRSVQTALGYSSVWMDMSGVAYPESEEDTLEKVVSEFSGNVGYYWQNFKGFSGTTVSECDSRIRNFLAIDYTDTREDDVIQLELRGPAIPVWFVLRTKDERIVNVDGGSWEQLESDAWLIEAQSPDVKIELR